MSEAVTFWLDNKMASALKVVEIGDQTLVDYRGKYYIVRNGAALMKGTKPLHYSKSSMPAVWKKALKGEVPIMPSADDDDGILPMASITRRVRVKNDRETVAMPDSAPTATASSATSVKPSKNIRKVETKPLSQTVVPAQCPYCNHKQDIPVEKGKNGKPFFVTCTRCTTDFGARFVPVTIFQAQVAAFR